MKIDRHICSCTVALHLQKYLILSLTNVEEVKRHMKVVTTLSNPFNSKDSLYFPSAQLLSVMFIVIKIHSPLMTVKRKNPYEMTFTNLKQLKEREKNSYY